jgi:hypothetical protein
MRTFLFAGTYADLASAEGDYEVIKILHSCDEIGSYDAAVLARARDGTLTVHKSVAGGISPAHADAIGALFDGDRAALVVVGSEADAGRVQQTAVEATRTTLEYLT